MKRVLIIGCPGSGKSTFARALRDKTGLSLCYLDMLFHRKDKTTCSREEFTERLSTVLSEKEWIIDGNYLYTMPMRLERCDTVFWLDYPLSVSLAGIEARRGTVREDMPWVETEPDEEFLAFVRSFSTEQRPEILRLLADNKDKNVKIFHSREEAADYLASISEERKDFS